MVIKIVLIAVSVLDVLLLLCVVSLNTRLKFAEQFMDERYRKAYKDITGSDKDAEGKEK